MICPVCKNSHPEWFKTHVLVDSWPARPITHQAFICRKCGVVFVAVTPEDVDTWHNKRRQELGVEEVRRG